VSGYRFTSAAQIDIERVLLYTLRQFGRQKYLDYAALIEEALRGLDENARIGKARPGIHPDAWVHPIAQPGRRARHVFLYEILDERAHVYGLFHDAMYLPSRWRLRKEEE
jgi:plasmid stabilization system protein ParE